MALRDGVVSLILRARNLMSKDTEEASDSLSELRAEGEKLDKKLDDLGRQEAAVRGFEDTKRAADEAARELERTVKEYEELRTTGRQAGETQGDYALKVKQARTAQSLANTEYRRSQRDLGKHTRVLREAGIETDDLSQAEDRIQRELTETRQDLDRVNDEAGRHARELSSASDSGGRFGGMLQGLKGKLLGLVAGVGVFESLRRGFTAVINTSADAEILQKRLDGLFGGAEQGARAMEDLHAIAERNAQSLQDTADAAIRLKVFGFDPLDGTLQRLIDANEKYGNGAQTLETLTTQLGQAYTSNRLQLEELNSITDAGIPILEALAEVTGRSVGELRDMASAGELGRDVIRDVVEELGDMAEGAGAKRLTTFRGLVSAVRKELNDFFREVGNAGVLDALKTRLGGLLTVMREAAADGSMVRWATDIAESFQSMLVVVQRVGSGFAIAWNGITSAFRTAAAVWLGAIGSIASGLSKLAGFAGADDLARSIKEFADNAKGAAGDLVAKVAQDGEDIRRHYKMAFLGAATEAEKSAQRQKQASEGVADAAEEVASREVAAAAEAAAKKRVLRLREQLDAAESFDEIKRLSQEVNAAQLEYGQAVSQRLKAEEAELKQAAEGRADAQVRANQLVKESLDQLGLEYDQLAGVVERRALSNFERIVERIQQSGHEAQVQSRIVAQAYTAAFSTLQSEAARVKLENLGNEAVKEGVISAEQLAEAWRKAADASDLAEQAIQKRTAALQAQQAQEQAELNLRTQLVQLSQAENEAALALARAKGDETEAARLLIEQKRLEVQLSQLRAEALHAEAAAELQQVEAIRQELQATNSLTEAKRAELAAREAAARAKEVEAQIADVVAEKQQRLIQINREVASSTREVEAASRSAGAAGLQMGNQIAAGAQTAAQSLTTLSRGYAAFRNQLSENYGDDIAREFEQLSTDVFGNTNVLGAQNEIRDRIRRAEQEYQKAQAERDPDDRYRALRGVNERYLPAAQRAALESTLEAAKEAARASREQSQQQSSTSSSQSRTQPSRTVELRLRTDSGQTASVDVQESQAEGLLSVLEQAGIRSV